MNINHLTKIASFSNKHPRNKLIIVSEAIEDDFSVVDIGLELSKVLKDNTNHKQISMFTADVLDNIMSANENIHPVVGKYTAISNIGVLLESVLKINFVHFIETHSKNQTLILKWDGEMDKNTLYFLSKNKGQQFDLTNISHITL